MQSIIKKILANSISITVCFFSYWNVKTTQSKHKKITCFTEIEEQLLKDREIEARLLAVLL